MTDEYETLDSGERREWPSGMRRDTDKNKPRFDLLIPKGQPYKESYLYRWAMLMARGAEKYGDSNWTLADSEEEYERFKASAFRHFMQWLTGEVDEDHAAAVAFNVSAAEYVKGKLDNSLFEHESDLTNADIAEELRQARYDEDAVAFANLTQEEREAANEHTRLSQDIEKCPDYDGACELPYGHEDNHTGSNPPSYCDATLYHETKADAWYCESSARHDGPHRDGDMAWDLNDAGGCDAGVLHWHEDNTSQTCRCIRDQWHLKHRCEHSREWKLYD